MWNVITVSGTEYIVQDENNKNGKTIPARFYPIYSGIHRTAHLVTYWCLFLYESAPEFCSGVRKFRTRHRLLQYYRLDREEYLRFLRSLYTCVLNRIRTSSRRTFCASKSGKNFPGYRRIKRKQIARLRERSSSIFCPFTEHGLTE